MEEELAWEEIAWEDLKVIENFVMSNIADEDYLVTPLQAIPSKDNIEIMHNSA